MESIACPDDDCTCDGVFRRSVDDADLLVLECVECGTPIQAGIQA